MKKRKITEKVVEIVLFLVYTELISKLETFPNMIFLGNPCFGELIKEYK